MGEVVIRDTRGEPITLYMSKEAIEFLDSVIKEMPVIPKPGRGRIVEELLFKEKFRREKAQKSADKQPAA